MTGLEISLLVVGAIIFIASFIFSSKSDTKAEASVELSNKQKEDMRNHIITVFDDQMDSIIEKTEIMLDKMANQKMTEMNDYSEVILGEINKNHNEVMFLYDMLNEKKKEVNNTVRDLNIAKKEIITESKAVEPEPVVNTNDEKTMPNKTARPKAVVETDKPAKKPRTKKETVLDQLDAVANTVADDTNADTEFVEATNTANKKKKKPSAKVAANRTKEALKKESVREEIKDNDTSVSGNNNERILELNSQGKSNVEIAKELGLGIGEVKLVVDLFRGGR